MDGARRAAGSDNPRIDGTAFEEPLTHLFRLALVFFCAALAACASTLSPEVLQAPSRPGDTIEVREFTYGGIHKLLAGTYVIEYEDATGYYFRGPGNVYRLPDFLNHNKVEFPDNTFPGGLFISKTAGNEKPVYRPYFYVLQNVPGAKLGTATPTQTASVTNAETTQRAVSTTVPSAGVVPAAMGGAISGVILDAVVRSDVGQIRLMPATSDIDIGAYVTRSAH